MTAASALPADLEAFFNLYTHPCFALQAAPLFDALTTRPELVGTRSVEAEATSRPTKQQSDIIREGSTYNQVYGANASARGLPSSAASGTSSALREQRNQTTDQDTGMSDASSPAWNHSSLLEGGHQKDHDPSRTAEGAVAAHREQQQARRDRRRAMPKRPADSVEQHKQRARQVETAVRGDKWANSLSGTAEEGGNAGERGRQGQGKGLADLLMPVWGNTKWEELVRRKSGRTKDSPAEEQGPQIGLLNLLGRDDLQRLLALLVEVMSPPVSSSKGAPDYTIAVTLRFPRNSANSRSAAAKRKFRSDSGKASEGSANKNNAYASRAGGSSGLSGSLTGSSGASSTGGGVAPEINGFNFQLVATKLEKEDLIVFTTIASNIFFPPLAPSPPSPIDEGITSKSATDKALSPASAEVQVSPPGTTVPSPIPPDESVPSLTNQLPPPVAQAPSVSDNNANSDANVLPSRPPLTHHETSLSTTSSDKTALPTHSFPTPTQSRLGLHSTLPSPSTAASSPLEEVPPYTGHSPVVSPPLERSNITELNGFLPGHAEPGAHPTPSDLTDRQRVMTFLGTDEIVDPARAFVTEKQRKGKRKHRRRGQQNATTNADRETKDPPELGLAGVAEANMGGPESERELTLEEEKEAGQRERQARKWREEQAAATQDDVEDADGEQEDDDDDDEVEEREDTSASDPVEDSSDLDKIDRELDSLRRQTRTGSTGMPATPMDENPPRLPAKRAGLSSGLDDDDDNGDSSPAPLERRLLPTPLGYQNFIDIISATPVGRLIAQHPWENTSVGPMIGWCGELRIMVMRCLTSPQRFSVWWGPDHVLIYNDEYAHMLGNKHPAAMGVEGSVGWAEVWDTLGPLAARVMQGESISAWDQHFPVYRNGFLEENYHSWSYLPIRNAEGHIVGYENPSTETTARVVAERRLATLRDLAQVTQLSRTTKDFFDATMQVISANPFDLPFALAYSVEPLVATGYKRATGTHATASHTAVSRSAQTVSDLPSSKGSHRQQTNDSTSVVPVKLILRGTVGVPKGHPSAQTEITAKVDLTAPLTQSSHESDASSTTSNTGTGSSNTTGDSIPSWPFAEACSSRKPVFIADLGPRAKGFEQRGWPSEVKHAVVIPLLIEGDSSVPKACVVVGLNPRRPWNEVFATFINLMSRSMSMGLLNVTMAEREALRTQELMQLDQAKTRFFSNVSHELRTPLTLILGPLEDVLAGKAVRGEDRERLIVVQKHGNRLLNMVNTLLDFSRLEGGQMEVIFRPVQMGPFTADLASQFRAGIERGGVQLIVDVAPEPSKGPSVYIAPELYEKVIFNLLSNSLKYTVKGSITVRVVYDETSCRASIIDTGCGIESKELGLIFDRFHRVESTSRTAGGTGIGLALTLELVKTLGGTLEVESTPNEGSEFSVTIPRGISHLPPAQVVEEPATSVALPARAQTSLSIVEEATNWRLSPAITSGSVAPRSSSPNSASSSVDDPFALSADLLNLKDSTILLADDNADLRHYLCSLLGRAFRVVQVEDGEEALQYCLKSPPALVVSDVMMPKRDGQSLLEALRANPSTALIPVIFLSAQAGDSARVEALLSGADDYLVKPFQGRELLARVNIHLQLGKMRLELERRVEERTRALIESEMRFRALADRYSTLSLLSPVGIFMASVDGEVNYANPRFYEISGCDPEGDLLHWRDNIVDEDREEAERVWQEAIKFSPRQGMTTVTTMEFRWKKQDNWVLLEIRPFSEDGVRRGFVGSITDISSQKHVEALHIQEVERRAQDAEENRRNTDAFLDMSSHELRNPLSGVWQNAQVVSDSLERYVELLDELREGDVPDQETLEALHSEMLENVEAVESIILCASHQQRIADDILNVSKLNMGLLSIQPVPFELSGKIQEVINMFSVECQQKAIKLSMRKASSIAQLGAEWIVADPGRIAQVCINFTMNSVKYTSESKRRAITIHLDAFESSPPPTEKALRVSKPADNAPLDADTVWITIGVEDSGKGLTPEELKKLFARFAQANPKSDQYGGSGLGLYVSKKLVELHHGFIEVESSPGKGSLFRFAIPAKRAIPPVHGAKLAMPSSTGYTPIRGAKSRPGSGSNTARPPAPSPPVGGKSADPLTPSRVLIVEDNVVNQKVLSRQLKMAGYVVTVANNGREGLDYLIAEQTKQPNDSPISACLMDIEMPVMGGLEAIRTLREMERTGEMPVHYNIIAVTGNARTAQIELCLEAGCEAVAVKPYNFASLLSQLRAFDDLKPTEEQVSEPQSSANVKPVE